MDLVREFVNSLPAGTVVVSGTEPPPEGVRRKRPDGVDETAIREARRIGLPTKVWPAKWERPGGTVDKRAGFARNVDIVADSHQLRAYWDGVSTGSAHTISLARAAGKLQAVIGPDGEEVE